MLLAVVLLAISLQGAPRAAAEPLTIGETFTLTSRTLKEVRRINVWTPPGYAGSPDLRLPVLYMPDGGIEEDFLHIAGLLQVSIGNGTMRAFILVGIENTERRRDMTGPTQSDEDRKIAPRVGGSAAFRAFIRRELMPEVQARYRTTSETAIVGESLAGLFVVETFLREADLFDTYIAIDPSLWWNDEALLTGAAEHLRSQPVRKRTLFLASSGEEALAGATARLAEVLKKGSFPGVESHYAPMPSEAHATIYHPAAMRAFRVLFKPGAR